MKAIIIGATSGIGKSVAEKLLAAGWIIGITGRRGNVLENFKATNASERVFTKVMDVTLPSSTRGLDELIEEMGSPDLFLYVSGVGYQNIELDEEKEIRTVKTNAEGMVRLTNHFIHHVKARVADGTYSPNRKAHVAVVTSVAGTAALGTAPAYSATKKMQSTYLSALAQLSKMEKLPILFTDIRPGFVATDILNPDKRYPMVMTVDTAATHIIKGLARRKRILTFDWRYRVLVFFWRLIPLALWERITWAKN